VTNVPKIYTVSELNSMVNLVEAEIDDRRFAKLYRESKSKIVAELKYERLFWKIDVSNLFRRSDHSC